MPDAAKPRKGSKRDASSTEEASHQTKAQKDASTGDVAHPSQEEMTSQKARPEAGTQGTALSTPPPVPAQEVLPGTEPPGDASAAETSVPTEQQELTREQLERLRNRLKTRFHS